MAALKLLVAAAIAYVVVRAGWIFGGPLVAVAAVVLAAAAYLAWRRGQPAVAAGEAAGALVSAFALTL